MSVHIKYTGMFYVHFVFNLIFFLFTIYLFFEMSLNYAESLSPYANKGKCGLPEKEESLESIESKINFYSLKLISFLKILFLFVC